MGIGSKFLLAVLLPFSKAEAADSAVLIGWDGARAQNIEALLARKRLPNLARLIAEGGLVRTQVTTGATQTKPGWAEILTGHRADLMGIESNKVYKPIPEGFTIFEVMKRRFPEGFSTIFISGKSNNVGYRGPHEICVNCETRMSPDFEKTLYWDKSRIKDDVRTRGGGPRRWSPREGEPFFHSAKSFDLHKTGLGDAANVGKEALAALERFRGVRFFAFFHFEDPDEQGHRHREDSREYGDAIETADQWLGKIVERMKTLGIYDRTAVFVTADHGMDPGQRRHRAAADTFLATNVKRPMRAGDRKDVAPTVLEALGIEPGAVRPKLDGRSLFTSKP